MSSIETFPSYNGLSPSPYLRWDTTTVAQNEPKFFPPNPLLSDKFIDILAEGIQDPSEPADIFFDANPHPFSIGSEESVFMYIPNARPFLWWGVGDFYYLPRSFDWIRTDMIFEYFYRLKKKESMPFTDKYLETFSLGKKVKISRVCKLQKMVPQKYRVVGDYSLEYYRSGVHVHQESGT